MDYKEKYEQAIENLKKVKAANKDNPVIIERALRAARQRMGVE